MRKLMMATAIVAVGAFGSTACATKGYVRNQVGQVSSKVDTLSTSLEETQERTRQNEAKITEVDQRAQAAAGQAQQAATAADGKATEAITTARTVGEKTAEIEKATNRIVYEVVLSEDAGNFKFGRAVLPDESKAAIDEMVTKLLADPKGSYFEIEGHTDNVGDANYNKKLGQDRADAVKAYLYEQHKIPLHKINVVSYGEAKPVEKNNTSKGRAMNRRVVIRVLG